MIKKANRRKTEEKDQPLLADPTILINGTRITTTSTEIARAFGKSHDDILKKIDNLKCSPDFFQEHFTSQESYTSNAALIKSREFLITKDGFAVLVTTLTGTQVARIKEAYIKKFYEMESILTEQAMDKLINITPLPNLLTSPDKFSANLHKKITQKAHELALSQYDAIHGLIHEMVKKSLDAGADEATCEYYIENHTKPMSGVTLINTYELQQIIKTTTNLINTAGETLAIVHKLESYTGIELYARKGDSRIDESLCESVLKHVHTKNSIKHNYARPSGS